MKNKPIFDLAELLEEVQDMIEERQAIYYPEYKEKQKWLTEEDKDQFWMFMTDIY